MKKVILDTNAFTSLFKGDERVLDTISKAETVYVSIFVLGELLAGFKGGSKEIQNKHLLNRFFNKPLSKFWRPHLKLPMFLDN